MIIDNEVFKELEKLKRSIHKIPANVSLEYQRGLIKGVADSITRLREMISPGYKYIKLRRLYVDAIATIDKIQIYNGKTKLEAIKTLRDINREIEGWWEQNEESEEEEW